MNTTQKVRWGIMGTGWVAQRFLADLAYVPNAKISAIASRTLTRAQEMATRFQADQAYGSYEELTTDRELDIIYVATSPNEHVHHCLASLNQGKHVLCEKPFAADFEEAKQIVELARSKSLFCMEAMWSRFLPGLQEAKRKVNAGAIGEPVIITADFGIPIDASQTDRFFDSKKGGGALLDRGVYPISLATWFFGKPLQVISKPVLHEMGQDQSFSAVCMFAENKTAVISASLSAYTGNQAVIGGTKGRLTLNEPFYRPERITVSRAPNVGTGPKSDLFPNAPRERVRRILNKAKAYLPSDLHRASVSFHRITGYGYGYEASEANRCILEGLTESPIMPLRDTLIVMDVVRQIQQAVSAIKEKS